MNNLNFISKFLTSRTPKTPEHLKKKTDAYITKHIAKLPDSHPIKSQCMKLLEGEEVECEDVTPFLDGLKKIKRLSPISFLCIWTLGRMRMSEKDALEASTAIAKVCEKEYLGSKSSALFRNYKRSLFYMSPVFISIAVFSIWQSHIISQLPPANYSAVASIHFEDAKYTQLIRLSGIETATQMFLVFISMFLSFLGDKPFLTSLYLKEIKSFLQLQRRPETVSTLIGMYFRFRNPKIGTPLNIEETHLKTLLEIMTVSNEKQITYNGSLVMKRFGVLIHFLNSSTLENTTELMSTMLETVERTGDSSLVPVLKEVVQTNPYPWIREAAHKTMDLLILRSTQQETLLRASGANVSETLLRGSNPLLESDSDRLLMPAQGSISSNMETAQHETMDKIELKHSD